MLLGVCVLGSYTVRVQKTSFISSKAETRNSSIEGRGLFALEQIKKGEIVVRFGGNYTDAAGAEEAEKQGKLIMQWDTDLFSFEERGDDDSYFINHSCNSNVWMTDAYTLVARRDIEKGEEITADYALWESDENHRPTWRCRCASSICRGHLTGEDWKNSKVQAQYRGHFSPLINKRIEGQ